MLTQKMTSENIGSGPAGAGPLGAADLPEDGQIEAENRLNNLMWTVSGDYQQNTKLDYDSFLESKYVAMYDAVKQGGLARFYDGNALALYIMKKTYCGAESGQLTRIAQMCVDEAVYPRLSKERPGIVNIRREAYSYLLEHRARALSESFLGRIRWALMRGHLSGDWIYEERLRIPVERIRSLGEKCEDRAAGQRESDGCRDTTTDDIIRVIDELYNTLVDPYFVRRHGSLDQVLAVTVDEMRQDGWKEFLQEEAEGDAFARARAQLQNQLSQSESAQERRDAQTKRVRVQVNVDAESAEKMYGYIEKTHGKNMLTVQQQKSLNYRICKGIHEGCSLYYTKGIIESPVMRNAQYVRAVKQMQDNQRNMKYYRHAVRQNIETMTAFLKRALYLRTERERTASDHGNVIPSRLWKIGRLEDPGKLFYMETRRHQNDFAVEVLIDASGSQHDRVSLVAIQAYIISCALSGAGIPHEMVSFCTFWDYTVMQQFRDYDDPPERDGSLMQLVTSANNRDGLAIAAAGDSLRQRPEENKILIVLSDGKPNDVIVGRPGSRNPAAYVGKYAARDAAMQVRRLRGEGMYVLGVFTGNDEDLPVEKRIFGKDFAYIRDIRGFSRVVGAYLIRLLERDDE